MDLSIDNKIANLASGVELVNKMLANLADELKAITSDKSIPVLTRWSIWCEAPDTLKGYDSSYVDIFYKDTNLVETWEFNRGQTVNVGNFINNYIKSEWSDYTYEKNGNFDEEMSDIWLPEGFEAVLEDLMAKNVGSFRYDW